MNDTKKRTEWLKKIMSVQSKSNDQEVMVAFLKNELKRIGKSCSLSVVEDEGNLYITKGEAKTYPCVVAHMDTVHHIIKHFKVFEHDDVMYALNLADYSRAGIGGDDKVGIFLAFEALMKFDNIKVAFFRDEEIGCVGSGLADLEFFEDVSFALQADRKGYDDFVKKISGTQIYSDEFGEAIEDILKKYGKKECLTGGLTDVYTLFKQKINVCVANVSCGYYYPHTDDEIIVISEVLYTSDMFMEIIDKVHEDGERWEYEYKTTTYSYGNSRYGDGWDGYSGYGGYTTPKKKDNWWDEIKDDFVIEEETATQFNGQVFCDDCGATVTDMYDVFQDGYWCMECNDYVFLSDEESTVFDEQLKLEMGEMK